MKIDLDRLHKVHFNYPNLSRGVGRTYYIYDSILRTSQLGESNIIVVTTSSNKVRNSFIDGLIDYLRDNEVRYMFNPLMKSLRINKTEVRVVTHESDIKGLHPDMEFID